MKRLCRSHFPFSCNGTHIPEGPELISDYFNILHYGVEARGWLLAPQMDAAAFGASSASPTGHSCGLGTAASIVGAARWRISPPSEIQRFLIWMQSLMPNPWGKYDMMKSFSRQNNTWRLVQGPILHVPIARSWFYSHRSPLYKLAAQRSKIFFTLKIWR